MSDYEIGRLIGTVLGSVASFFTGYWMGVRGRR